MALHSLRLRDFGAFEDATFEFCPGLNVIIGENATGKSHAMKAAYSVLRSLQHQGGKQDASQRSFRLEEKLRGVFRPKDGEIGRLVRRGPDGKKAVVELLASDFDLRAAWGPQSIGDLFHEGAFAGSAVFVPSREVFAMYEGFVAAYEGRELAFDETYYDICKLLSATPLRGERAERAQALLEPLREVLGGEVSNTDGRFYLKQGVVDLEAHLVAEGLRKIASLYHLINTGALTRDSILFWDEPEASLNPRLVEYVVQFLVGLVGGGVQVILASHDYLLTHRLSVLAEYGKLPKDTQMRFFSLLRPGGPASPVEVEHGDTLAALAHNPILDEFARFHEDEEQLAFEAG